MSAEASNTVEKPNDARSYIHMNELQAKATVHYETPQTKQAQNNKRWFNSQNRVGMAERTGAQQLLILINVFV